MIMNFSPFLRSALLLGALLLPFSTRAEAPEWIWHDNHGAKPADNEVRAISPKPSPVERQCPARRTFRDGQTMRSSFT